MSKQTLIPIFENKVTDPKQQTPMKFDLVPNYKIIVKLFTKF